MIFGYIREYTGSASVEEQKEELINAKCQKIFMETGNRKEAPVLNQLIDDLQPGDTLIIDSLVTLGRTSKEFTSLAKRFINSGFNLRSLSEPNFDTSSTKGKNYLQAFAEFRKVESEIIGSNIKGIKKEHRNSGGRKKGSYNKKRASAAAKLYQKGMPIKEIMEITGIKSKETLYNNLRWQGVYDK